MAENLNNYKLVDKLAKLTPYDPIEGRFDIRLDANESFFNLDADVKAEVLEKIGQIPFNRYPDPYAKGAVKAFADLYGLDEKYVTAGNGSDELISIITSCFLNAQSNIVTLAPDFSMYAFYGSLYEQKCHAFGKNDDLTVNVDEFIKFCKDKDADMVIFSNPCNPTSCGIEKDEVRKIIEALDCLVVLDEAYMDFWDQSLLDEIEKYDNLIILKTCSKAFGLASIRMGFAVAGEKITTALKAAKSPYNTDTISQVVTETVLRHKEMLYENVNTIIENKNYLLIKAIALRDKYHCFETVYPSKTNFIFIKTEKAQDIFEKLMKKSIAVRKFTGYLRITAGNASENEKLLFCLEQIISEY